MKKNIAVVFGGYSSEAVISERSSLTILKYLPPEKYNAFKVRIEREEWNVVSDNQNREPIDKTDFSFVCNGRKTKFDCAYMIIHGAPGENGLLQSYFDMVGVPYTTCNPFVSALAFNKYACKCYLRDSGINMPDEILIGPEDSISSGEIVEKLGLPVFVKPNAGGSSFGITKVKHIDNLPKAIDKARKEDHEIIIESYVKGREFSHGIVITEDRIIKLPVTEIITSNEFFDYEAKYADGISEEITPANISDELSEKIRSSTEKISKRLNCRGIIRIDYICADNDKLFFLEINTVPGMSEQSIVPKQLREAGYSVSEIIDLQIQDSLKRA